MTVDPQKAAAAWARLAGPPGWRWTVMTKDASETKTQVEGVRLNEADGRALFEACWPRCPEGGTITLVRAYVIPATREISEIRSIAVYYDGSAKEMPWSSDDRLHPSNYCGDEGRVQMLADLIVFLADELERHPDGPTEGARIWTEQAVSDDGAAAVEGALALVRHRRGER